MLNESSTAAQEGVHATWRWNGKELVVSNCRYGMYPLFYFADRDNFCVSPSLIELLKQGAPRDLDHAALAVFLRLGFFLGEDTPFRAIRQLPPNAKMRWSGGQPRITSSLEQGKLQRLSRDAAIDGYVSLFRAAVRRRLPRDNDFVVPISGGRDSRHILLELLQAGCVPKFCVTARHFPPRANPDIDAARRLCAELNVRHTDLGIASSRVAAELRKNQETHLCTEEHAWGMALADFLQGNASVLYDGLAGDILSAGLYQSHEKLRLYYANPRELALSLIRSRTDEAVLARLLDGSFYQRISLDQAVERVTAELARHQDSPNPLRSFYFWNRTRRTVALFPFGIMSGFDVHTPYLDHELYDFLASLPPEMSLDHQFHTETIWQAHPRYRSIPFERKGDTAEADRLYFRRLCSEMAGFVFRHGRSELVQRAFVLSRLAAGTLDGNPKWTWWGVPRTLLLLQLEAWMRSRPSDELRHQP